MRHSSTVVTLTGRAEPAQGNPAFVDPTFEVFRYRRDSTTPANATWTVGLLVHRTMS